MAVVQISKIQIRRGQKNQGIGLPQLASGELGWAIDTRELFIGNGSVAEGAPTVGNTKILTQYDDLFTIASTYTYKDGNPWIKTGPSSVSPVQRSLQDRLDDIVNAKAFGVQGEPEQDATVPLQQAINQLFLNDVTKGTESSRVKLYLDPGIYIINSTIFLPPFTTLIGAGAEKTVIRQQGNFPLFETINGFSTENTGITEQPSSHAEDSFDNQARNIHIEGMTLKQNTDNIGINLINCRDSNFIDLHIIGAYEFGDVIPENYDSKIGIRFESLSEAVSTNNCFFIQCKIANWAFGALSKHDVNDVDFSKNTFFRLAYGMIFGIDMTGGNGAINGARYCKIDNCNFDEIFNHAIWFERGIYNVSKNNKFTLVGNNGGTDGQPITSVMRFKDFPNSSINDVFSRTNSVLHSTYKDSLIDYKAEIDGMVSWESGHEHYIVFTQTAERRIIRLPGAYNQSFVIEYYLRGRDLYVIKKGTLIIQTGIIGNLDITLTDDYEFIGSNIYEDSITFAANIINADTLDDYDGVEITVTNPLLTSCDMRFKIKTFRYDIV